MQITVKLFASLSGHLPPGSSRHQAALEMAEGTTPYDVIKHLNVPERMAHLVMIDGVYVAPEDRRARALKEGEQLAIFPPVAGG